MPLLFSDLKQVRGDIARIRLADASGEVDFLMSIESAYTFVRLVELLTPPRGSTWESVVVPDRLEEILGFFAARWQRLYQTNMAYTQYTNLCANEVCYKLAEIIAPHVQRSTFEIIMPTLTVKECAVTGTALTDRDLRLQNIVVSDKGDCIIEVPACLEFAERDGILKHTSRLAVDGQADPLSNTERRRVIHHRKEAYEYYQASVDFFAAAQQDVSLGASIQRLIDGLRSGGAHKSGEEFNAGASANKAIIDFALYLESLEKINPSGYKFLMQCPTNGGSSIHNFTEAWGRLARPADTEYKKVAYCVELIANGLERILEVNRPLFKISLHRMEKDQAYYEQKRDAARATYRAANVASNPIISRQWDDNDAQLRHNLSIEHFGLSHAMLDPGQIEAVMFHLAEGRNSADRRRYLRYLNQVLYGVYSKPRAFASFALGEKTQPLIDTLIDLLIHKEGEHLRLGTCTAAVDNPFAAGADAITCSNFLAEISLKLPSDLYLLVLEKIGTKRLKELLPGGHYFAIFLKTIKPSNRLDWLKSKIVDESALIGTVQDFMVILSACGASLSRDELGFLLSHGGRATLEHVNYASGGEKCDGYQLAQLVDIIPVALRYSFINALSKDCLLRIIADYKQVLAVLALLPEPPTGITVREPIANRYTFLVYLGWDVLRAYVRSKPGFAALLELFTVERSNDVLISIFPEFSKLVATNMTKYKFCSLLSTQPEEALKLVLIEIMPHHLFDQLSTDENALPQLIAAINNLDTWQQIQALGKINLAIWLEKYHGYALLKQLPPSFRWAFFEKCLMPLIDHAIKADFLNYLACFTDGECRAWVERLVTNQAVIDYCPDTRKLLDLLVYFPHASNLTILTQLAKNSLKVRAALLFGSQEMVESLLKQLGRSGDRFAFLCLATAEELQRFIPDITALETIMKYLAPGDAKYWFEVRARKLLSGEAFTTLDVLFQLIRYFVQNNIYVLVDELLQCIKAYHPGYFAACCATFDNLITCVGSPNGKILIHLIGRDRINTLLMKNYHYLPAFLQSVAEYGMLDTPEKKSVYLECISPECFRFGIADVESMNTLASYFDARLLIEMVGIPHVKRYIIIGRQTLLQLLDPREGAFRSSHGPNQSYFVHTVVGVEKLIEVMHTDKLFSTLVDRLHLDCRANIAAAITEAQLLERFPTIDALQQFSRRQPLAERWSWLCRITADRWCALINDIPTFLAIRDLLLPADQERFFAWFTRKDPRVEPLVEYYLRRQINPRYYYALFGTWGYDSVTKLRVANTLFFHLMDPEHRPLHDDVRGVLSNGTLGRIFKQYAGYDRALLDSLAEYRSTFN